MKHFDLEMIEGDPSSIRRIETRVLVRSGEGIEGFSYEWDEEGKEAYLADPSGVNKDYLVRDDGGERWQTWRIPSRLECNLCHTDVGGFALGFNTAQLNREIELPNGSIQNQLKRMEELELFEAELPAVESLPALVPFEDESMPLTLRARSFLAANCLQCHQPGGQTRTTWDARFHRPLSTAGIIRGRVMFQKFLLGSKIIDPGAPENSMILNRLARSDKRRMPPLASSVINTDAVDFLTRWTLSIPQAPWIKIELEDAAGDTAESAGAFTIWSRGAGIGEGVDSGQYLVQPVKDTSWIRGRLTETSGSTEKALAGLCAREDLRGDSPSANLVRTDGELVFIVRQGRGQSPMEMGRVAEGAGDHFLLVTEGSNVEAFYSGNGEDWVAFGRATIDGEFGYSGLMTSAGGGEYVRSDFESVQVTSASLEAEVRAEPFEPAKAVGFSLEMEPSLATETASVKYSVNGREMFSIDKAPFEIEWADPVTGLLEITAAVNFKDRPPIKLFDAVAVPEVASFARFLQRDTVSLGDWIGRYGEDGYHLKQDLASVAWPYQVEIRAAERTVWRATTSSDPQHPIGDGRVGQAWHDPEAIQVECRFPDSATHRVSLYFGDHFGPLDQEVEVSGSGTLESLDRRQVFVGEGGAYLSWAVRGNVTLTIRSASGDDAVLSALFLDPLPVSLPKLEIAVDGDFASDHPALQIRSILEGPYEGDPFMELAIDGGVVGQSRSGSLKSLWRPIAGHHLISVRAFNEFGQDTVAHLPIEVPWPSPQAHWVGEEVGGRPDWMHSVGRHGYMLSSGGVHLPVADPIHIESRRSVVEMPSSMSRAFWDPAIQQYGAAWWHDNISVCFEIALPGGMPRLITFYAVDWNSDLRAQKIRFKDLETGEILEEHEISEFRDGRWVTFFVRGRVGVEMLRTGGANAVLSGIFIDPIDEPRVSLSLPELRADQFVFHIIGPIQESVVLEQSGDLSAWVSMSTNWLEQGILPVQLPAGSEDGRYFRVRVGR